MPGAYLESFGIESRNGDIRIPYLHDDDRVHRWRVYGRSGKTWWEGLTDRREQMPLIPYGLDTLPSLGLRSLYDLAWCEGESDTLALRLAIPELVVLGAPGASSVREDWRGWCLGFRAVYVLGDGDPAGRRFNNSILAAFPGTRVVRIPDGDDVRAILQRGDTLPFEEADATDRLYRLFLSSPSLDILEDALTRVKDRDG